MSSFETAESVVLPHCGKRVFRGPRGLVPYVALWEGEEVVQAPMVRTGCGVGYADEHVFDRDAFGLLWTRVTGRPGVGEPHYARLHPLRQRRAMRQLLCQLCSDPADRTDQGVLWLSRDKRHGDDPQWPNHALSPQPPLCEPCARMSVRMCPWLRESHVAIRARSRIVGASGALYCDTRPVPRLADVTELVGYDSPARHWLQADQLVRELVEATVVAL